MRDDLVYGLNSVEEALRVTPRRVSRVFIARESRGKRQEALLRMAREAGVPVDIAPLSKVNTLAGSGEHQGVAAIIAPLEYAALEDLTVNAPPDATLVALDRVQNPRNLGLIIRSCAGAGVHGLLLPTKGGALAGGEALRASAGAAFHIPIAMCDGLTDSLRFLKDAGFWVYGLDAKGGDTLYNTKWSGKTVLVTGNESEGLRPTVSKACDALIRIPLERPLDSLNAALATTIAVFHIAQCKRAAGSG